MNPFRLFQIPEPFKNRSPQRDRGFDDQLITAIATAIDTAIQKTEAQRAGLERRINDVIARAAIVAGNELDEHLTRDEVRSNTLSTSEDEMKRAQDRLKTLDENLSHFEFLRAALHSRLRNHE